MNSRGLRPPVLGSHAFRYGGYGSAPGFDLPLIPVTVAAPGGRSSLPLNAILDTGSTDTVVPESVYAAVVGRPEGRRETLKTPGGVVEGVRVMVDLAIVDSHLPSVICWAFEGAEVFVAAEDADFPLGVLGWDLLSHFEVRVNRDLGFIELKRVRR